MVAHRPLAQRAVRDLDHSQRHRDPRHPSQVVLARRQQARHRMGAVHAKSHAAGPVIRHARRGRGLPPRHRAARPRTTGHGQTLALLLGDRLDSPRTVLLRTALRDRTVAPVLALLLVDLPRGVERPRHLSEFQPAAAVARRTSGRHAEARVCRCDIRARPIPDPHRRRAIPRDRGSVSLVRADVGWPAVGPEPALPGTRRFSRLHRDPPVHGVLLGMGTTERLHDRRVGAQHHPGHLPVAGHRRGDHRCPRRGDHVEPAQTAVGAAGAGRGGEPGPANLVAPAGFPAELSGRSPRSIASTENLRPAPNTR